jgi:hypothetical protein
LLYFKQGLIQARINAITICSDNAATVCNLQRQGVGLALLEPMRAIFRLLTILDIRLHVAHIPGRENILVDGLSRMEITGDYELKTWVFSQGIGLLGIIPTIDLFSHNLNHKLPRFVSMPGPLSRGALSTDAFSHAWTGEIPYIFPPVQLLGLVFQKIIAEQVTAVVVLPKWPSLPWWTMFLMTQI